MLASTAVNLLVSELLMRVGKETDSIALRADAWHLRTDVYTSVGVMLALIVIGFARLLFPGVQLLWLDPIVAMVVAVLIVKAAWDLTAESVKDLLDVRLMTDEETWIRDYAQRLSPVVRSLHSLRTRKSGHRRFIDFHLVVDGKMSVTDSHRISDQLDAAISAQLPHSHVTVHIEPCDRSCHADCETGCFTPELQRRKESRAD
jgi:cation diffusion facilitator family transporter